MRRFQIEPCTDKAHFGATLHNGGQIAAQPVLDGAEAATAMHVAMHVAAINPAYLDRSMLPAAALQHQTDIFTVQTKNVRCPEKIVPRIVVRRVNCW